MPGSPSPPWSDGEEAEVNAALLHLHDLLQGHQPEADLLRRVNRFCVEVLDCDFSSTYIWDPERDVFRLVTNVGAREEVQKEFPQVEFPRGSLPLIDHFRLGEIVELEDTDNQSLVPPVLFRSLWVSSTMFPVPADWHQQLVDVLAQQDPEAAERKMRQHVCFGAEHQVEALERFLAINNDDNDDSNTL